jgi:hypothetical protein
MLAWCSAAKWCCCCCCCCCLVQAGRPQQTIAADGFGPDMGGRPLLQCSGLPAACHGCHDGCPSLPSAATPSRGTFHHPWILRTSKAFSHTHTPSLLERKKKQKKPEQDPGPGVSLPAPAGSQTHWPVDHNTTSLGPPILDPMGGTQPCC